MPSTDPAIIAARGKVRLGAWMIIAGSLGAVMALLTYIDVWDVSDSKPTGWGVVAALCAVLAIAGFVVLWGGLTAGAKASAASAPPSDGA
jgi:hypothetical protein